MYTKLSLVNGFTFSLITSAEQSDTDSVQSPRFDLQAKAFVGQLIRAIIEITTTMPIIWVGKCLAYTV